MTPHVLVDVAVALEGVGVVVVRGGEGVVLVVFHGGVGRWRRLARGFGVCVQPSGRGGLADVSIALCERGMLRWSARLQQAGVGVTMRMVASCGRQRIPRGHGSRVSRDGPALALRSCYLAMCVGVGPSRVRPSRPRSSSVRPRWWKVTSRAVAWISLSSMPPYSRRQCGRRAATRVARGHQLCSSCGAPANSPPRTRDLRQHPLGLTYMPRRDD